MFNHSPSQKSRVRAVLLATAVGSGSVLAMTGAGAGAAGLPPEHVVTLAGAARTGSVAGDGLPADDAAKGVVNQGLALGHANGPCAGLLEEDTGHGSPQCTHGPDPAPAGVDVRTPRSVQDLALSTAHSSAITAPAGGTAPAAVPCYGDGTTGDRVQAIYAHASDTPDRYSSLASMFPQWAANADAVFARSAAQTGGTRHLRWVTDAGCTLSVARVTLSPTGDDNMTNTELELQGLGFDRSDRKYMVWVDANVYCGIGDIRYDDSPGATNMNNDGRSWARVDSGCWGMADSPESHEIEHMMGGVQPSAPHASAQWHCTDESDRMCYSDAPGVTMTYPCPSINENAFDCNHDDYFSTAAPAGSYLATHWNSADNVFLETTEPGGGTTTTTAPPTTSTTVPTSTTSTWSGSFKGNTTSKAYAVSSGAGTMVASSTYTGGGPTVTLTVTTSAGAVLGQTSGPSGVSLSVSVPVGSYNVTISGARGTSYALKDTRPA